MKYLIISALCFICIGCHSQAEKFELKWAERSCANRGGVDHIIAGSFGKYFRAVCEDGKTFMLKND
jgi:hypothetical protein